MAVWTDAQFVALQLPGLADPVVYNGVTIPLAQYLQNWIDTAGSREGALYIIFQGLAAQQPLVREKMGEYEYQKQTSMTFKDARDYWLQQAVALGYSDPKMAPRVWPNDVTTMPWLALPPAWR
jgi:hypothetical protein